MSGNSSSDRSRKSAVLILAIAIGMLFAGILTSCSTGSSSSDGSASPGSSAAESSQAAEVSKEDDQLPMSQVLVAYFSQTGNTEAVAEEISAITGANLFRIIPEEPYTDEDVDYSADTSRANGEQADAASRPAIADTVKDMFDYEVVFIGFPIWWGEEPRIIDTFLESYDFNGKTVIPFCTSGSSGISAAEESMQRIALGADWLEGKRFAANAPSQEIRDWVEGMDLSYL